MKKYHILTIIILFNISFLSAYTIKLASYGNKENLIAQVSKLDKALSQTTHVIKDGNLYKAFSKSFPNREKAIEQLNLYKTVFPDAYVSSTSIDLIKGEPNLVRASKSRKYTLPKKEKITTVEEQNNTVVIEKSNELMIPTKSLASQESLAHKFTGHTFYICPNRIKSDKEKLLIEVSFKEHNVVTYKTLLGKIPSIEMGYIIQNGRIYFSRNGIVNPSQFSQVDETFFEYYIISKWSRGRKIHSMRFYNKRAYAESYLNSLNFN